MATAISSARTAARAATYALPETDSVLTPALAIYSDFVQANIDATLRLLGKAGAARWRPHVKTSKSAAVIQLLAACGVRQFKCATTLELLTACKAGAEDVLVAYPLVGAAAARVQALAQQYPRVRVSALVDSPATMAPWAAGAGKSPVSLFIDVNPGMDRTGVVQADTPGMVALARAIRAAGIEFRGLHYYDGHLGALPLAERIAVAHRGYDQLLRIVAALEGAGLAAGEVITAGTPALPCSLAYAPFTTAGFAHRVSPGTVIFNDLSSLEQLPPEYGYRPAALVLARVVSHPTARIVTCDAGHKAVSVDCGTPNCRVLGWEELVALKPSEEHLPFAVPAGAERPPIGEVLYLLPRHVCPTINNFDHALWIEAGRLAGLAPISARGHERPLPGNEATA